MYLHIVAARTDNYTQKGSPRRMPRTSRRLTAQEVQNQKSKKLQTHKRHIDDLGEPCKCHQENCSRQARHRGSWCQMCFDQHFVDKNKHPVFCQGCPSFLGCYTHDRILVMISIGNRFLDREELGIGGEKAIQTSFPMDRNCGMERSEKYQ